MTLIVCPVCGKKFIKNTLSIYKYLDKVDKKNKYVCCYTCLNKATGVLK